MTTTMRCPLGHGDQPASLVLCPECLQELERLPEPRHRDREGSPVDAVEPVTPSTPRPRSVCWNCHKESPNPTNTECTQCHESLVPPALVLSFTDGQIILGRGETVELGRSGKHANVFRLFRSVSRRHAVIGADSDGRAWIRPIREAVNGTSIDGMEITETTTLAAGMQVRFASESTGTTGTVRLPERE